MRSFPKFGLRLRSSHFNSESTQINLPINVMPTKKRPRRFFSRVFGGRAHRLRPFPESTGLTVHALHKSASMFLYKFFHDLSQRVDVGFYSINHSPPDEQSITASRTDSFILGPIRSFNIEDWVYPRLNEQRFLIQVRDPRDILVSEYFSLGWLHSVATWNDEAKAQRERIQATSIDQFVMEERLTGKPPLRDRMQPLFDLSQNDQATIVTYEEMVTDFPRWLSKVLSAIDLDNDATLTRHLLKQYEHEFTPSTEGGHKRNVTPGDHLQKLKPETVSALNEKFADILAVLGYPRES